MHVKKISILIVLLSTNVYAEGFSSSVGGDYSTGKYGSSESTDVFYLPFGVAYDSGAFTYRLTIPYIRVTGSGDIVPSGFGGASAGGGSGGGGSSIGQFGCAGDSRKGAIKPEDNGVCGAVAATPTTGGTGGGTTTPTTRKRSTESGLGDIVASINYNVVDQEDTSGWIVDLNGRIKFGTASESRGLGSGETDYALGVSVDKYFGAPYVSVGLGYKVLGEPRGVKYDNVVYGALGGGYKFSKKVNSPMRINRGLSPIIFERRLPMKE